MQNSIQINNDRRALAFANSLPHPLRLAHSTFQDTLYQTIAQHVRVKTKQGWEAIPCSQILYCQARSNYTKLHLIDERSFLISYSLKQVLANCAFDKLLRIHQSYAINTMHMQRIIISKSEHIELINGKCIPISRRRKKTVQHLFFSNQSHLI